MVSYFKELKSNPDRWFNVAFGLIGLPGIFALILSSYSQNNEAGYLQLSVIIFYIVVISAFLWSKRPKGRKPPFDMGETFSPFHRKKGTVLWIRTQQKKTC